MIDGADTTMAVREFTDEQGIAWRAWDVRPESIHPATKAEDYLADCYVVGWIVFENLAGNEKRRLCPYPNRWGRASVAQLREMLARAERVPPRKLSAERQVGGGSSAATATVVPAAEDKPDVTDLHVVRTFRYPGGRLWTVCVIEHPEDGAPPALRFAAGIRSLDLRPWPRDWADAPNERLVEMLRRAAPRRQATAASANTRRRRWDDKPADVSAGAR
jgi:hypothetical protein